MTPDTHSAVFVGDEDEGDLFVIAYDGYMAACDAVETAQALCARLQPTLPEDARRSARALIGLQTIDGRPVPRYAHSHEEIATAAMVMRNASNGDPISDLPVIEAFEDAAHAALDLDDEQLAIARQAIGLDVALLQLAEAVQEQDEAREWLLSIVPISQVGAAYLAHFLHSQANGGGSTETVAKAARNLASATNAIAGGPCPLPTLH